MITDSLTAVALVGIMRIRYLLPINRDMNRMGNHINRINHHRHRVDTNSGEVGMEVGMEVDLILSIKMMLEIEAFGAGLGGILR